MTPPAQSVQWTETGSGLARQDGLRGAQPRDGRTLVHYGTRPGLEGWLVSADARPPTHLLPRVRPLAE